MVWQIRGMTRPNDVKAARSQRGQFGSQIPKQTDTQQLLSYYRYQTRQTTRLIGCQLETIFGAVHINPNNRESTTNIAFSTSPQTTELP